MACARGENEPSRGALPEKTGKVRELWQKLSDALHQKVAAACERAALD
jgi:hypothetical protein